MNASEFYENFKEALKFLGVSWSEMHQATVKIRGDHIEISALGKSCSFSVPIADK